MSRAWLSLGANVGDPPKQLLQAVKQIDALDDVTVTAESAMIVTAPWGKTDQADFHNMAIAVETTLPPEDLLSVLQDVEKAIGRTRAEKWGPRIIDIDIIAYNRMVQETKTLTLPHPYAHDRDFVMMPLREISEDTADWILTMAGMTPV